MKAWYEEHFQEDYLRVYDHRDETKAASELNTIMEKIPLTPGAKAIDLCCGNGRHARWLARKGVDVTGIDLSPALLKKAIELTNGLAVQYQRGDIRNVQIRKEYDLAFNLFTSFGYFPDDEENELIFQQAASALKPGGWFVFDYLNPEYIKQHIVPRDETVKDGLKIYQERSIQDEFVVKRISIVEGDSTRRYMEKVKMYQERQLRSMMEAHGLQIHAFYGDYDASPFQLEASPRQIFIAQLAEQ